MGNETSPPGILCDPKTRTEWLKARQTGIGGSDAGCVAGVNRYKSPRQLWREKTGRELPEDISDKPAVQFGKRAEPLLRGLFALTHPEYQVTYHPFRMYGSPDKPFIFATLDGELTDADGRRGILEIKTTCIRNHTQWREWDDRIPDSYYAQILHQLLATGWDFAILYAHIRYMKNGAARQTLRTYSIDRADASEDIRWLLEQETAFWKQVQDDTPPPDILPEI